MTFSSIPLGSLVLLLAITASELVVQYVSGHGRVMEPPNRASLWRFPEFSHLDPPQNYEDNELFCGNFSTQYERNGGKCGVCGDPYHDPVPRKHEDGGENYRDIIVRGYRSGQLMPVEVDLTASHLGYLEFRLCANDDRNSHLSQGCYDQHVLKFVNKTTGKRQARYKVPIRGEPYYAKYSLELPKGVTCKHCVLQWHYQTGNRWGNCSDGTGAMGCGEQEVFRGCSDIIIYPEDTDERNINRNPNSKFGIFPATTENVDDADTESRKESNSNISSTDSSMRFLDRRYQRFPIYG